MFNDNLKMAIGSIRSSRLRSFLTLLGVIIGVFSVITSVSLAEGVRHQVIEETNKLGNDVLTVRPGQAVKKDKNGVISSLNIFGPSSPGAVLTEKDLSTIRDTEGLRSTVPLNLVAATPSLNDKSMEAATVIGTTPELPEMLKQKVEFGDFFTADEKDKKVAVIGSGVAEQLFGQIVPIGHSFNIRGQDFVVQGVLERHKTVSFAQSLNFNDAIFIPYESAKQINNGVAQPYEILARVNHVEQIDQVEQTLHNNLKNSRGGLEDFTILQSDDTQLVTGNVLSLVTTMVGSIAAISMVVGGIGIMNIMLASVSERTREIGIRKAVGATKHQIRNQFLMEAAVLSVWGALIGVIISALFNVVIRIATNLQPIISWQVVLLSVLASVLVGIIFGTAPAVKASRKDPIEALRSGL